MFRINPRYRIINMQNRIQSLKIIIGVGRLEKSREPERLPTQKNQIPFINFFYN